MNIKGGALEFDIIANNGQINSALAETKRRVQRFTNNCLIHAECGFECSAEKT